MVRPDFSQPNTFASHPITGTSHLSVPRLHISEIHVSRLFIPVVHPLVLYLEVWITAMSGGIWKEEIKSQIGLCPVGSISDSNPVLNCFCFLKASIFGH